jgi:hypothetical protein
MNAPEWTKTITSEVVCGYYYIMFIVACVFAAIAVLGLVGILLSKLPMSMKLASSVNVVLSGGLAVLSAMFLYIMCTRSLLEKKQ